MSLTLVACWGKDSHHRSPQITGLPSASSSIPPLPDLHGTTVKVAAEWNGSDQEKFTKVLQFFSKQTGVKVNYVSTGTGSNQSFTSKIDSDRGIDVAFLPRLSLLSQFAASGRIKPVGQSTLKQIKANYSPIWQDLGRFHGKQYGVSYKATDKSIVWRNAKTFDKARASEPQTWRQFIPVAQKIADSGIPDISIAGADGATLSDWFENVYLSQSGPDMYSRLAHHKIKWTDPSVERALDALSRLFTVKGLVAPDPLHTDFRQSIVQTFSVPPKSAMTLGADSIGKILPHQYKKEIGATVVPFLFPADTKKATSSPPPQICAGDIAVSFSGTVGAEALLTFLASPQAGEIWAQQGDFISPNSKVAFTAYSDAISGYAAAMLNLATSLNYDMSDQESGSFGGTGAGSEARDLQKFLQDPHSVGDTQRQLESDAARHS
ncbi:ABC transporter substrate-binding protein [Streptomyces sp. NPDC051133]|uniref:ABC transporter substrate-binding protein n=1 Tax=Streptomyces sp. NPDC051133 TaxID=3155521 RepID=UPI00343A5695